MSIISTIEDVVTMSSREIATLTGKEHKNVMRDVRKMLNSLDIEQGSVLRFDNSGANGKRLEFYQLDKELTHTLITGYSVVLRNTVIKRLIYLEEQLNPQPEMPNFSSPADAARAWALEYEARQLAERTKAEIGSRREATAMATASVATKKAAKLEIELDQSKQYYTVKRMQMLYHGQEFKWRLLKSTSIEMGMETMDVFDANYGKVKTYHLDVWQEAYAIIIEDSKEGV